MKEFKKNLSSNRAITLIALIITIIIMLILVGVSISLVIQSDLIGIAEDAGNRTESAYRNEAGLSGVAIGDKTYNSIEEYMDSFCTHEWGAWQTTTESSCQVAGEQARICTKCGKTETQAAPLDPTKHTYDAGTTCTGCGKAKPAFSMAFGTIEVVWIDKNNNIIEEPLAPVLNESMMTPVKWTNDEDLTTVTTTEKTDTSWYNYVAATSIGDNTESKWANVEVKPTSTSTASYFVWIPRYAYRITYYNSEDLTAETTVVTGYCDGRGLVDVAGEANNTFTFDEGVQTVTDSSTGKSYIVHPAFETDVNLGGWTEDLAGLWVAKYEMSGSSAALKSTPNASALTNVNIANMYNYSKSYSDTLKSHLMKNSEWGAVAYLTHCQYGRNTVETSCATSLTTASGGILTSTTGNTYGIYGMSGGAAEYVAAYNTAYSREGDYYGGIAGNTNSSYKPATGAHFAYNMNGESDEYVTAYTNSSYGYAVYATGKIGDATKEVFDGSTPTWHGNSCYVFGSTSPFSRRGGDYYNSTETGVFESNSDFGQSYFGSFRVVFPALTFEP